LSWNRFSAPALTREFRQPVRAAGGDQRAGPPFPVQGRPVRAAGGAAAHPIDLRPKLGDQGFGPLLYAARRSELADVPVDLLERLGVEHERVQAELLEALDVLLHAGHRQGGDDKVGFQLLQPLHVDVEVRAELRQSGDMFGRIVGEVVDADDPVHQAEGVEQFGVARTDRDNSLFGHR